MSTYQIIQGDALAVLRTMPAESVHCVVTSPPYWGLRDFRVRGQLGLERTPEQYVSHLVQVFRELRRVLRSDGTVWLNLGDSYANDRKWGGKSGAKNYTSDAGGYPRRKIATGLKGKDLVGIPWRVAFALQSEGWWLRADIIWHKPNVLPESVKDRPTKCHEYLFLFCKSERYYYNAAAIREPFQTNPKENYPARARITGRGDQGFALARGNDRGKSGGFPPCPVVPWREKYYDQSMLPHQQANGVKGRPRGVAGFSEGGRNKRSVWTINTQPFKGAHFATFPEKLVEPCILAGSPGAGKACDCDKLILTPVGEGPTEDPTLFVGRAGYNRRRRPDEGRRVITRREQREYARQIRNSPHRAKIQKICGEAFSHYIRTDRSGARPLPDKLLQRFLKCGWLKFPGPCECPVGRGGVVLDPFAGSGTVGVVALRHGRSFIGIELNESYCTMARERIAKSQLKPERDQAQTTPRHSAVSDVSPKQSAVEVLKG